MDRRNYKTDLKLCNRLTYILRYGAIKEGLKIHERGFVDLDEMMELHLFWHHSRDEVLQEILHSLSTDGSKRFLNKILSGKIMIMAASGRNMEPSVYHKDCLVPRLINLCMETICKNIKYFDFENFPDEYLLRRLFMKLKHKKLLTNAVMKYLLSSAVESYNFHGIYITEATIKILCQRCQRLKHLKLKDCGYVVTDAIIRMIAKHLINLEDLNISHCTAVTDASLDILLKFQTPLKRINLSFLPNISINMIKNFLKSCQTLEIIVLRGNAFINEDVYEELVEIFNGDIFYIDYSK